MNAQINVNMDNAAFESGEIPGEIPSIILKEVRQH
jgi:hypothetical protein